MKRKLTPWILALAMAPAMLGCANERVTPIPVHTAATARLPQKAPEVVEQRSQDLR